MKTRMRPWRILVMSLLWLQLASVYPVYAKRNDIRFEHLGLEQGLSQSTVFVIVQDRQGFMWFGTDDGLNRYDGYNFTTYRHDPTNPKSLSQNSIWAIYEDRAGNFWVGTVGGGLNKFDRATEQFTHYQYDPTNPNSPSGDSITAIYEDPAGIFWIGTNDGLNRFDPHTGQWTRYQHDPDDPNTIGSDIVWFIYPDRTGLLWLSTEEGGLNKFDPRTSQVTRYLHDPANPRSLSHNTLGSIIEDQAGLLWVPTQGGGVCQFNRINEEFTCFRHDPDDPDSIGSDQVYLAFADRAGTLWFATWGGGLNKFDRAQQRFVRYHNQPSNPYSLSDNDVLGIYEDQGGVMWVGTYRGINKFHPATLPFTNYAPEPQNPHSLVGQRIQQMHADRAGNLWIATWGGLNKFDRATEQFTTYTPEPNNPNSLSGADVCSLAEDRAGMLWVGACDSGLNKFDPATGHFTHYQADPNNPTGLTDNDIYALLTDRAGRLWIGTFGSGLFVFDHATEAFTQYANNPDDPTSLSNDQIIGLYEDQRGMIWVTTDGGGVSQFDPAAAPLTFQRYQFDPNDPASLSSDRVHTLTEDQAGNIWVGTRRGLNRLDRDSGTFTRYTAQDGLPNDTVVGILEDQDGDLWISTITGLMRFNPATRHFEWYDVQDGLPSSEFSMGSCVKLSSGELMFGTVNGFTLFNPRDIIGNPHVPPVVLTDFRVLNTAVRIGEQIRGRVLLPTALTATPAIKLSYKDYLVAFNFAALDYAAPAKNQYAYRLDGFDAAWNQVGTQRVATYTNLPAGTYTLRVRGSNNRGVWNEEGTAITLTMTPPPWKTWWAYTLYAALLLGAIVGYVRYATQAQARELAQQRLVNERLRQVDKLKDDFLANTSHELRTPLNGIIGIAESLQDGVAGPVSNKMRHDLAMIASAGKRLSNLVNDILDFAKMKRRDLEIQRKPVDMHVLADVVLTVSETLKAGKAVMLHNAIPADLPPVEGDENRIQQIMYNLVGNAIKFTPAGSVTVTAQLLPATDSPNTDAATQRGMAAIAVTDTGIGIPAEKLPDIFTSFEQVDASIAREYGGTGLGLAITKQLVELHGGVLNVVSAPGQGSTFTFTLPLAVEASVQAEESQRIKPLQPAVTEGSMVSAQPVEIAGDVRILVVDDEPVNQQVLANLLTLQQYGVTQAFTGEDALHLLARGEKFNLVLLDIMMPRMSGYEVCQKIRETYLPSELPVLMLTAKDQVNDLVNGFASGANDYLVKPFSKDELFARIKTHLNLLNINAAYSRFVPFEFLRFLRKESIIDVNLGDQIEKEMTVLFSDIRDFTALSERMSPQQNFDFINSYLSLMEPEIIRHQGFIDKYIGDAIMALFPTSADDAVQGALAMLRKLPEYNQSRQRAGDPSVRIGIGLNTGKLILGTVGGQNRMDGTVISDAVNLASRLEGLTKRYGVTLLISETTLTALARPDHFHIRLIGKVQVKGKRQAVAIYDLYDGDPAEVQELKQRTQPDFDEGQRSYFTRDFATAVECFAHVLTIHPGDHTAQLYVQRARECLAHGVPDDWQGIEMMDSK